jgi:hypothetical protein
VAIVDLSVTPLATIPVAASDPAVGPVRRPHGSFTRRGLRRALGVLWLLDGVLQLQPSMLTTRFAHQVVAPAAVGQPAWVAWPVLHGARVIGTHPVAADLVFALVQLAIGVGLLSRRWVRPALLVSVAWSLGVWVTGEGLGGIAGGSASLLTGAPGAAFLYGLLGLAAWPVPDQGAPVASGADRPSVPAWFPRTWAVLWVALGASALLPTDRSPARVAAQLSATAGQVPSWLGRIDQASAGLAGRSGGLGVALLVLVPVAIGLCGLGHGRQRVVAAWAGMAVAVATWVVGESFGQLFSGLATDPNTGPLLVVAALALLGSVRAGRSGGSAGRAIASGGVDGVDDASTGRRRAGSIP